MVVKFVLRPTVLRVKHFQNECVCVACCGWAMLSNNDVRVMTSSFTPPSPLSVRQPLRKGEDVCEIRSSLFCAPQRNHYSNDTVSIRLGCLFHGEIG